MFMVLEHTLHATGGEMPTELQNLQSVITSCIDTTCNHGQNVVGVSNHSPTIFKAHFIQSNPGVTLLIDTKSVKN